MSKLISGIWYFNKTLPISTEDLSQDVNFISAGVEFVRMYRTYESKEDHNIVTYLDERGKESGDYYSNGWMSDEYRTVDFGSTPQSVSDEFYTWLTANATKSGLSNFKTVTESIKKYVDSKDADIKESVNSKAAAGAQSIDTSIAYTKDVPSDSAKYAGINKIGGMTRKCTNLIPYPYIDTTQTVGGVTFTDNGNGMITANGIASGSSASFGVGYIMLNHSSDYTFSIVGNASNLQYQIRFYDTNNSFLPAETIETGVVNYVLKADAIPANAITMHIYIKRLSDGAVSGTFYPMLNEGSTALPYEPYFEGLRDAKTTEMKGVGVNLWNATWEQGDINSSNGIDIADGRAIRSDFVRVFPNATYTIKRSITDDYIKMRFYDKDKNFIGIGDSSLYDVIKGDTYGNPMFAERVFLVAKIINPRIAYMRIIDLSNDLSTVYSMYLGNYSEADIPEYTPYMESTLPVPEAVQALDGYGEGVNADCYNYIDWDKKQFVQRVGVVDLGTLSWAGVNGVFNANISTIKYAEYGKIPNILTPIYATVSAGGSSDIPSKPDKSITTSYTIPYIYVQDTAYTNATAFKTAMSGVMLVYELAEPIVTDISDLLPDDNFIEVEGNGSITAVNEHGYDVPSEIVFNIKNNEQVNANTFVGDLIGKAQSAERDGAGRLLEDTYMSYSYDKVYTGETAAVSEFYAGETTYVSGVWKFNETIEMENVEYTQAINYKINGLEDNFKYLLYLADPIKMILCFTELNESSSDIYYDCWTDEAYRTVDFGEKDQLTSPEFYTWLCANARRVEA